MIALTIAGTVSQPYQDTSIMIKVVAIGGHCMRQSDSISVTHCQHDSKADCADADVCYSYKCQYQCQCQCQCQCWYWDARRYARHAPIKQIAATKLARMSSSTCIILMFDICVCDILQNKLSQMRENTARTPTEPPLQPHLNTRHFNILKNLFKKGYTSQVLLCPNLPPALRIPALLSSKLYDEAAMELLNKDDQTSQDRLWLVIASHAIGMDAAEYYQQLEEKHKEIADDWIQVNKPLQHPQEVKKLLRTKFEQLLLKGQEENYYTIPQVPVFLVSNSWLEKFYDDSIDFIPAVDNFDLYQPCTLVESDPKSLHFNYKLKEDIRENANFKIVPYEAWAFLKSSFGGVEFRRFTTNEKEPICEIWLKTVKIMVVQGRHIINGVEQALQIQVSRFDTISSIIDRVKKLMISYELVPFQALTASQKKWEAIRVSNIQDYGDLVDLIQNPNLELWKHSQAAPQEQRLIFERLEYKHDFEESELSGRNDLLMITIQNIGGANKLKVSPCIDIHSVPIKKILSPHRNQCLTCEKTEDLTECVCKTVFFCCKECKKQNKAHEKVCTDLLKEDSKIDNLLQLYGPKKREYSFDKLRNYGKVGLENLGNTCYLNSAIQCVLTLESLNSYFVGNQHLGDLNTVNVLGTEGHLACAYGEFVKDYFTTNRRALEPTKILKIIAKNPQFRGYNHQDSQEFLNYFLDKIHEDLNKVKTKPYVEDIESDGRPDQIVSNLSWENYLKRNKSFISASLAGQYRSQIRCPDCNRISITFDPFMSVTLPFPKQEKTIEVSGYFLTSDGEFKKVSKTVPAGMQSKTFLKKFFHVPVLSLWLKNKAPNGAWSQQKSVYYNIKEKGVLMFYPRPENATVEVRLIFADFDIFHRRIFSTKIQSLQEVQDKITLLMKKPLLKATKNQELLEISDEKYLQKCREFNFVTLESEEQQLSFPLKEGIFNIKIKVNTLLLTGEYQIKDKIKFDFSAGLYSPKEQIKVRNILDQLTVGDLLASFEEPQQLTEDNAWYCNKCKDHKLADKIMSIYKAPQHLILHLKRFNHRGNRYVIYGEKVKTPVILSSKEKIKGMDYELVGVVNHFGSLSFGHYTATVKREGQWFQCDDSSVRRKQADGSNAYLLFYKRIDP